MQLSIEELELLARRSRLVLTEKEQEKYRRNLGALEELSTALLAYTECVSEQEKTQRLDDMRPDRSAKGVDREAWLAAAPARKGDYIPVPCVVEEVEND